MQIVILSGSSSCLDYEVWEMNQVPPRLALVDVKSGAAPHARMWIGLRRPRLRHIAGYLMWPDNYHMNLFRSVPARSDRHIGTLSCNEFLRTIGAPAGGLLSMKWFLLTKNPRWTGYLPCVNAENNQWTHQNRQCGRPLASSHHLG